jgi:hypothetical protein
MFAVHELEVAVDQWEIMPKTLFQLQMDKLINPSQDLGGRGNGWNLSMILCIKGDVQIGGSIKAFPEVNGEIWLSRRVERMVL